VDWSEGDMQRFADTFRYVIWPAVPRPGQPRGAAYVDGSGRGVGWFSDGFVKLGRFDPALQVRLQRNLRGQDPQYLANGALNAALLGCHSGLPGATRPPACRVATG
jgi:hypothetical protein